MARTVVQTLTETADNTTYQVPTFTRSNNRLYELWIHTARNGGSFTISSVVDGGGLTWVEVATASITDGATTTSRFSVYRAMVDSGAGDGVIDLTISAAAVGLVACVVETDDAVTTGTNGSDAVLNVQTPTQGTDDSVEGPALDGFSGASNYAVLGVGKILTAATIDIEAGYTETTQQNTDSSTSLMVGWQTGEDIAPTATLSTAARWAAIAFEVAVSGGGGPATVPDLHTMPRGTIRGIKRRIVI